MGRDKVETSLSEFDEEMGSTRKILERVPEERLAWKERFDKNLAAGREALSDAGDELLAKVIPVMPGVYKSLGYVLRSRVMNHLIRHRGQLSVYLRLLDVAVPGMYGPSADEKS